MIGSLLREELRFLTFRPTGRALAERPHAFLVFGLGCTCLAGAGRYWDNPRATLLQSLGLGSVIYAFVLAAILWCTAAPLKPLHWSYRNVLIFVALTSPPALLYAIPVERWLPLGTAASINAWFLAVIAVWRVALLLRFLRVTAGLRRFETVVAALLPLSAIAVALSALNLEHVMFEFMAGIRPEDRSANDAAYFAVREIGFASLIAAPGLLVAWLACIRSAPRRRDLAASKRSSTPGHGS